MELAVNMPEQERKFLLADDAGAHCAAGDKNSRDIQSGRSHQKARDVFIAVRNHHERVKSVGNRHGFGAVSDQFTTDERVFHAFVSHSDAVADSDSREHDRNTAGKRDALFDSVDDLIEVHVSGDDIVFRADDTDQRFFQFFVGQAECVKQGAVRCGLRAFFDFVTSHINYLVFVILLNDSFIVSSSV